MAKKKANKSKHHQTSAKAKHSPNPAHPAQADSATIRIPGSVSDRENQSIASNQSPASVLGAPLIGSEGKNKTASSSYQQEKERAQPQTQEVSYFGQVAQITNGSQAQLGGNSIQKQHKQRITQREMPQEYYLEESELGDEEYQQLEYGEEEEEDFEEDGAKQTTAADDYYDEIAGGDQQFSKDPAFFRNRTNIVQQDEQVLSDLKYCLYCVYNNLELAQYFKQLLRLTKRLKEGYIGQLNANVLFNVFDECIKEFLHGIRDKVVEDARGLISHKRLPQQRHYSHDDYFLIDRMVHTKATTALYGGVQQSVELFSHCSRYLGDTRYEQVRADVRRQVFQEWRTSTEVIIPFQQKPEHYRRLFDLIIKYYARVREAVQGVEEIWVFLIESVFQRQLSGNLLFEQHHKQLFRSEILQSHRYIQMFLKEIRDSFRQLELRRSKQRGGVQQQQKIHKDEILDNLYDVLQQLEDDINYQPQLNQQAEQQLEDDEEEEIVTYKQLADKIRDRYGGQTLAQQVQQYSQTLATSQTILRQIQQDKRCQELLKSLPNLDTETLCYIIQNNLPPEDYEKLLVGGVGNIALQQEQEQDVDDSLVISPTKNLQFLTQEMMYGQHFSNQIYNNNTKYQDNNGELFYDEEEDQKQQVEKKKRKNQKKKQKRKQKKAQDTHQHQPYLPDFGPPLNNYTAEEYFIDQNFEEVEEAMDSDFDDELELFKSKLMKSTVSVKKRRPNVSPSWIESLKQKLTKQSEEGFNSPRRNAACKMGEPIPSSGGQTQLRVKYNQRSA